MADMDISTQSPGHVTPVPRAVSLDRRTILDATERVLSESGYDGCTIRQIAGQIGCAVGSIYRYFADKRCLLEAVTQRRLEPAAYAAGRGVPMREAVGIYARCATDDPASYRLMFWLASLRPGQAENPGAGREAMPLVVRRTIAGWGRTLGDEDRAQRVWSMVHGAIMLGRDAQRALDEAMRVVPGATEMARAGAARPKATIRIARPLAAAG